MGAGRYFCRGRTDTVAGSVVLAPLFPTGRRERELRQRYPARIASGLDSDKCPKSATALGDIKFRRADPSC